MPDQKLTSPATIAYGLTVAGMFVASFFPEQRWWGINLFGYFGDWARLAFLLVHVGLLLYLSFRSWPVKPNSEESENAGWFLIVALAATAVFGICFYLFRGRTHFLGDGAQLLSWLQEGIHNKPWEKGSYHIQSAVYGLLGGDGEPTARLSLQLVSFGAGLIALLVTAITAARLFVSNWSRLIFFLGLASSGQMLLYFGYFESYPLFVTAVTILVMVGLLVAHGRLNRWWLLPAVGLCGYFHIFTLGLIPAVLFLLVCETRFWRDRIEANRRNLSLIILLPILLGLALLAYLYNTNYFFRFVVVPPIDGPLVVESYTMFSGHHLVDYVNLLLQQLPGLPLLIVAAVSLPLSGYFKRRDAQFLVILTITSLTMVFLINPGLGMPRDWDLFAFSGIPLCALAFLLLAESRAPHAATRPVAVIAIALGLSLLIPRVAIQAIPEKGIALIDNFTNLDRVRGRQARFFVTRYVQETEDSLAYLARSNENWLTSPEETLAQQGVAMVQTGRVREAVNLFGQALKIAPNYAHAWCNLGVAYTELGQFDSAMVCLELSDALSSFNPTTNFNLGSLYLAEGDTARAEKQFRYTIELKHDHFSARWRLMQLLRQTNRQEEATELLLSTGRRPDAPLDFVRAAGDYLIKNGNLKQARIQYDRALKMGLDSGIVLEIQRIYPQLQLIDTTGS